MAKNKQPATDKKQKPASAKEPATAVMGRPSIYSEETVSLICSLLAEGQSLRKICALETLPHLSTVMRWLFEPSDFRDYFQEQYRRARQMQAEIHADEMVDIADDSSEDEIFTDEGRRLCNKEFVARSKLRVETRQWVASRLLPKVYGAKTPEEKTDNGELTEAARIFAEAMARTQTPGNNESAT